MTITNDFFDRLEGVWENKLDGQWVDQFGWNLISQPQLGGSGPEDFNIRIDKMRETISFRRLPGSARNIGITGQAGFWQGMAYQIDITNPQGDEIHQEMGHFLLQVKEDGETAEELTGTIIRQATIPRANAMMTFGILRPGSISDDVTAQPTPFYNARPIASPPGFQAIVDAAFEQTRQDVIAEEGPDFSRPLEWLQTILADNVVDIDWTFAFRDNQKPSQMVSGQRVVNPVAIGNLLSDFWIAKRERNGQEIDILQYAQKVDLGFNGTDWPHVAVNTLIKQ